MENPPSIVKTVTFSNSSYVTIKSWHKAQLTFYICRGGRRRPCSYSKYYFYHEKGVKEFSKFVVRRSRRTAFSRLVSLLSVLLSFSISVSLSIITWFLSHFYHQVIPTFFTTLQSMHFQPSCISLLLHSLMIITWLKLDIFLNKKSYWILNYHLCLEIQITDISLDHTLKMHCFCP